MNSVSGLRPPSGNVASGASPTEADQAFLLALAAWGDRCQPASEQRKLEKFAPDFIGRIPARLAPVIASSMDPSTALDRLRAMHQATARVDLERVHSSWLVRALREESPAIQRFVVGSLPGPVRHSLQSELLLDSRDLVSERTAAREAASWVLTLWSERLVGGEAERADDPPAIIMLSRLSPRDGYRLCRQMGRCKLILAGKNLDERGSPATQMRRRWLESRLADADDEVRARARADVGSSQVSRLPPRQRTVRIGLTAVARLLADTEPFRLRWALQHWPYPIAKLIRSLMPAAATLAPSRLEGEKLILKTAWVRLKLDEQLALAWPESPEADPRSQLT